MIHYSIERSRIFIGNTLISFEEPSYDCSWATAFPQNCHRNGLKPKDIDAYNTLGIEPLQRIGFVSDESNFYLENKAIFHHFAEILREGRKFGLHIVVAAHEWHKDTIKSGVNDLFQTRIALNSLSGSVVLRNHQWGKWVEGRLPGRGVLKTNKFEPIQG